MAILNLAWLIPLFPFLAFFAISVFTRRSRKLSHQLAIGGIAIAFLLAQIVFWAAVTLPVGGGEHAFESSLIHWLSDGAERFTLGIYIDPATAVMLFMVPLVCLMTFIYSVGYMSKPAVDPRYSHFFATNSLLATAMLGLVVFDNLLTFVVFWQIMDICAYLLISFWYEKESAYQAGLKAFLVTKVSDMFFMLGLVLLYSEVGSLAYRDIFSQETLEHLAHTHFPGTQWPMATVITLLLVGGTAGKSAQFPLHVWLPDAVECPTPASALIHAATTVPAGVFLIVRTFPILTATEDSVQFTIMAAIGVFTAILGAGVAVTQNDIRRVLAFSTISQVGYIVAALGIGAYVAGVFHLITHSFFKALLFLGSGSVVHGMEQGHSHDHTEFNPNDMMNMGGLAKRMPRTFWTFLIGGMALSGFPLVTAGFWSQNGILGQAYERDPAIFWGLVTATGLTAFYTMRQICLTFSGPPRTQAAEYTSERTPLMTVPLIVLAIFAVSLGWIGMPEDLPIIGGLIPNWFHHFVGSTIKAAPAGGHGFAWRPPALGLAFGLGGLALGWLIYGWKPMQAGKTDRVEAAMRKVWLGWLYAWLHESFYLDEIYQGTIVRGSILLADSLYAFDRSAVDELVNLAGRAGRSLSRIGDWLDGHVVDALVNQAGMVGRRVSEGCNVFDLQVVNHLVDMTGSGTRALSDLSVAADIKVVDGAVKGVGATIRAGGRFVRPIQTGKVQNYLLRASLMLLTLIVALLMILFLHI